ETALRFLTILLVPLAALLSGPSPLPQAPDEVPPAASGPQNPAHRFPDFGFMPPAAAYEGRVFRLRQDYPRKLPPADKVPQFCRSSFDELRTQWRKFLLDVR